MTDANAGANRDVDIVSLRTLPRTLVSDQARAVEVRPGRHLRVALAGDATAATTVFLVHGAGGNQDHWRALWQALPASRQGLWRETAAELAAEAAMLAGPGDVVMVKGSNGSKASTAC